jgi:adenosine kinase
VFKDALDQTEPYWDYIIGNESEARAWAQSNGLEVLTDPLPCLDSFSLIISKSEDIVTIAKHLANLPKANPKRPRTALITQGSASTIIAVSGISGHKDIPVRKISAAEIIDTTGAG